MSYYDPDSVDCAYAIESAARLAYEAGRDFAKYRDDYSHQRWEYADASQIRAVHAGVMAIVDNPGVEPQDLSQAVLGILGQEYQRPAVAMTVTSIPLIIPFESLSRDQIIGARMFKDIVTSVLVAYGVIPGDKKGI